MKDLGVPLIWQGEVNKPSQETNVSDIYKRTLSRTLSSEFGQSIAKQTRIRSVSGYDSGRSRSYSSWPAVSHSASSTVLPVGGCVG